MVWEGADEFGAAGLALGELLVGVGWGDGVVRFLRVIEERHDLVVFPVLDGVVFVRVALGALESETEPCGSGGGDAVGDCVEAEFEGIDAALLVEHGITVKAGGDDVIRVVAGEQVAGQLGDGELVERHVGVERADDPVAVWPDFAGAVFFVAIGIGVACEVEPFAGPAFAVLRRSEEAVDRGFVGSAGIGGKGSDFLG